MAYFLVENEEINKEFQALAQSMLGQQEAIRGLLKELGAETGECDERGLYGVEFKEAPDSKLWKKTRSGSYTPKKNSNAGKALAAKFKKIPSYSYSGINKVINFPDSRKMLKYGRIFFRPALQCLNEDHTVWIFKIPDWACSFYEPPAGVKEITYSEFEVWCKEYGQKPTI